MKAVGWSNGSPTESGGGYGVSVSTVDRDRYFRQEWTEVVVRIGRGEVSVKLSPAFWRRCSELRAKEIGRYLLDAGLAPWPKGYPPVLELVPLAENSFTLRLPDRRTDAGAKRSH